MFYILFEYIMSNTTNVYGCKYDKSMSWGIEQVLFKKVHTKWFIEGIIPMYTNYQLNIRKMRGNVKHWH